MAKYLLNPDEVDIIIGALIHFNDKTCDLIDFFQQSVECEECDKFENSD